VVKAVEPSETEAADPREESVAQGSVLSRRVLDAAMIALDARPPRRAAAAEPPSRGQVWTAESAAAVLDGFMAAMPAIAFVNDSAGRYLYVNRQLLERFGDYFGSDWFGKTHADIWPADIAALFHASDAAALAADAPIQTTELMPIGETHVPFLVTKFPIHTLQGVQLGGIGIDITHERALATVAARDACERALIADTLKKLPASATSEATAQMICRQVASLSGVVSAAIMRFAHDDRGLPMGMALANGGSPELRPIPYQRSRYLHERAAQGAWIEAWVHRPWHPYNKTLNDVSVRAHAYAPIHYAGTLIGLLAVGSAEASAAAGLAESMPALVEFAGLAGVLIGPDLAGKANSMNAREPIVDVLDRLAFHPVFQPIVDLKRDRVVGYEALTRFEDGTPPDEQFAAAEAVGLGLALETVTLRAAIAAAGRLRPHMLLNLNASPALVLEGKAIRSVVRGVRQRVVFEITEHTAIADYAAFHRAVEALGPSVRLAVDDAGVGFASFRHILEIKPAFVKLDRWIVSGIDRDPAKQALVAGVCQFARSTGCELIAEGVETETERAALVRLGVRLAQGYLLGRPGPLPN
jgi:EAL domain-containing protein (putative c-di-GMP-specific phosphodiesterase class I)/PAS domain-containing protein